MAILLYLQSKYIILVGLFPCQYNIVFDYTTFATSYIPFFFFLTNLLKWNLK